jgi:N-acyl-D-aspartate/D-glutamate deacylase
MDHSDHTLIRGGDVLDGTGAAAVRADVRLRDGQIVEIGPRLAPDGAQVLDATGAVVTPGFIDTHAHTDPQVFWDPAVDPELLHGVTTMLVGNCSLSLYPVNDQTRPAISDLFSYIEDVPRHLFDDHVPWTWSDFAGYRDAVNAQGAGVNLAPLVGHSPLRLAVMGEEAWTRAATSDEIDQMAAILADAMAAGAWGLSTSFLDVDQHGRPVPSRAAEGPEFDKLLDVVQASGRGLLEVVPNLLGGTAEETLRDLGARCGKRGIPLTWTGFVSSDDAPEMTQHWVDVANELAASGARIYPQLSPRSVDFRLNWDSSMMFMSMPAGWHRVIAARGDDKRRLLADPEWRATARDEWDRTERAMFPHRKPERVRFVEVVGAENEPWRGRTLAELVAAKGGHPSDVLADFVLANDCRPGLVAQGMANASPEGIARFWQDPVVLVSSSDAGAHAQMLCASGDTTLLLTRHVRERGDFSLADAVHRITGRQAEVFGFSRRGVLAVGNVADVNVFALDELTYGDDEFVTDLPGGGARLRRPTGNYRATFVGGTLVQENGKATGALPGQVIRAG